MVVDDDESVRLRVRDLAEADGCRVEEAASGEECLRLVALRRPDLVILDLMMPGMSGVEVCARLRADQATREIPIIVLSAADRDQALPAALEAGAEDYLPKPVPASELRAKVRNILWLNRYHALRRERDRLRWLFEHSCEPLVRLTRGGLLREANLRAREIFGFPERDADNVHEPTDALAVIGRDHRADPADALDRLLEPGAGFARAFTLHRPETSLLAARWYQAEVHEDADSPSSDVLLKLTEHSDRVRHDLEAWAFHRVVSHKLRTPLNGIGSLLDLLLQEPDGLATDTARELVAAARESATRLEQTVFSILRYHDALRGEAPRAGGCVERPADEVVREAALEAGVPADRLRVVGDTAPRLPAHLAEPLRLVVGALADNCLKFAHVASDGLEMSFKRPPGRPAELRIFAPGPVLAPELVARLGRPYWQIERSFTGEVPGAGLGLATCRLLLGSFGGELRFSASEDPPGLVSTVILPPDHECARPAC